MDFLYDQYGFLYWLYQNWKRLELFEWEYYVIGTCKIPFIINLIQSTFGAESITVCFFEIWLF